MDSPWGFALKASVVLLMLLVDVSMNAVTDTRDYNGADCGSGSCLTPAFLYFGCVTGVCWVRGAAALTLGSAYRW